MLEKKYRLCKRKQFNYIYKKGRSVGSDCVTLVYNFCRMPNIKVGFSASKKVGGSVQRHRALRIMREAVRPHIPKMVRDHNYIFVAKDVVLQKSVAELQGIVKHLLTKAGLLNE